MREKVVFNCESALHSGYKRQGEEFDETWKILIYSD